MITAVYIPKIFVIFVWREMLYGYSRFYLLKSDRKTMVSAQRILFTTELQMYEQLNVFVHLKDRQYVWVYMFNVYVYSIYEFSEMLAIDFTIPWSEIIVSRHWLWDILLPVRRVLLRFLYLVLREREKQLRWWKPWSR